MNPHHWTEGCERRAQELASLVQKQIEAGVYKKGNPLPHTDVLVKAWRTNNHVLVRIREILKNKDLVWVDPGRGTFVK